MALQHITRLVQNVHTGSVDLKLGSRLCQLNVLCNNFFFLKKSKHKPKFIKETKLFNYKYSILTGNRTDGPYVRMPLNTPRQDW